MRPFAAALLLPCLLTACVRAPLPAAASLTPPTQAQPVASASAGGMVYTVQGPRQAPVVVLQGGLGEDRAAWVPVQTLLAARYRVFAADRPGYGDTPTAPGHRDPCRVAAETRQALRDAGLRPPYLLVGQGLGGLYQYVFARLYPEDSAGLLLLDPAHPQQRAALALDSLESALDFWSLRPGRSAAAMRAEFEAQTVCLDKLPAEPLAQVPSTLLMPGRPGPRQVGPAWQQAQARLQQGWLDLLGAPPVQVLGDAGHRMHRDAPGQVAQALDALAVRGRR